MWDQAVLNTPKIPEDKLDEDNFDPSVTSPDHPYWSTDFSILETEPAESRLDSTQPDSTIMASTSRQEGSDMSGEKDTSQPIIKTIQNADPASTTIRHTAQICIK
ncbi:hypothetical protein RF11_06595 [Thelohanellus kitauei]|uniref:Uncharacterized protein n=1 Tax=Thelohanellus kitauei TaxID=669202 RepID=A0A0C2MSK0_THEKT|nr:hypothetical protein RF11_06595 [Thelohanellus kitauei]